MGRERFIHDYVWVNDGMPSAFSAEQKALDAAEAKAVEAGLFDQTYGAKRIILDRMPCISPDHRPNCCAHIRVSFWDGP